MSTHTVVPEHLESGFNLLLETEGVAAAKAWLKEKTAPKVGHTPGPWTATKTTDHYSAHRVESTGLILDSTGNQIADTGVAYWHNLRASAAHAFKPAEVDEVVLIKEANARLIAAAPELLEVLKWAETCMHGYFHSETTEEKNYYVADALHALERMHAAIAKAEGNA